MQTESVNDLKLCIWRFAVFRRLSSFYEADCGKKKKESHFFPSTEFLIFQSGNETWRCQCQLLIFMVVTYSFSVRYRLVSLSRGKKIKMIYREFEYRI